jgi:hypothetical protein
MRGQRPRAPAPRPGWRRCRRRRRPWRTRQTAASPGTRAACPAEQTAHSALMSQPCWSNPRQINCTCSAWCLPGIAAVRASPPAGLRAQSRRCSQRRPPASWSMAAGRVGGSGCCWGTCGSTATRQTLDQLDVGQAKALLTKGHRANVQARQIEHQCSDMPVGFPARSRSGNRRAMRRPGWPARKTRGHGTLVTPAGEARSPVCNPLNENRHGVQPTAAAGLT